MISEDSLLTIVRSLLVPQHRHGHPAGIARIGRGIELVQVAAAVERVAGGARRRLERPAVLAPSASATTETRDDVLQPLQRAEDQRAVRPWAGQRDVEMIAARLGLEAALARWARAAVRGDPVAELRCSCRTNAPPVDFVSYQRSCHLPSISRPMVVPLPRFQSPCRVPAFRERRGMEFPITHAASRRSRRRAGPGSGPCPAPARTAGARPGRRRWWWRRRASRR